MKRREFLRSTLLFAAISTVAAKATGLMNAAEAAVVWVTAGKLGYKEVSPQAKNGKQCSTCKHYKADAATASYSFIRGQSTGRNPRGIC